MNKPSLQQFQSLMEHSLLSETVDNDCHQLMSLFTPKGELSDVDDEAKLRLAIYRNNVMHSLTTALADLYPVIEKLVGEACFKGAAIEFVRQHQPEHPALLHYGKEFSEFIGEYPPCQNLPFLADVALLEFNYNQVYHAADSSILDPQELVCVAPEQLTEVSFTCIPSLNLMSSSWPIDEIWRQNQQEEQELINLDVCQTAHLAIFREGYNVQIVNLEENCFYLLQQLSLNKTIGEAWQATLEDANNAQRELDESELGAMLGYLFSLEILSAFKINA